MPKGDPPCCRDDEQPGSADIRVIPAVDRARFLTNSLFFTDKI
jgi:hypothetical protein